jgi:hypothetical protein
MSDDPLEPKVSHVEGLPWPLDKALGDTPFAYLVMLRNGVVIECQGVERPTGEQPIWITLVNAKIIYPHIKADEPFNFERGMCVRIEDIVAAVDAPHGS